jgi:hypothetical protein
MPITAHRESEMDDEHSPYWKPEDHASLVDFLSAVARGALFAAAIAMFLTLLGCDDYERELAMAEYRERFMELCMPRKGDLVTVEWVKGELICMRTTPTGRYGRTFPHTENRVAIVEGL